ncbi:MAG: DEAD/DEAH box helicase family protein [Tannerellaceae bacterium]|jgi:superfamily II DNA or RNA helicase|nr:DEAD/DEAH box helicase family protein [Tannerellaceae bacterium]
MEKEELIIVLSEHKVFGWKLTAYLAGPDHGGWREILGAPDNKPDAKKDTHKDIHQIIALVRDMSDEALMKDYSKQKSVREFRDTVSQETKDKYIRPRIENLNRKIIQIADIANIPVYLRTDLKSKNIYETNRLRISSPPAKCIFNFVKDEKGFRYFISIIGDGQHISLLTTTGIIISEKPCSVIIDKTIYNVDDIEAKKLVPFFTKSAIPVSAQLEETYLKTFVFKTMQDYEVNIKGIPLKEITPEKKAILSLERDFNKKITLIISFRYQDNKIIYPGSADNKNIGLERIAGKNQIWWYRRNRNWENSMIDILLNNGLVRQGSNHFYTTAGKEYDLIEWINANRECLADFDLEMNLEKNYYAGTISITPDIEMKIDWFEVHIAVSIGQYTYSILTFRQHILKGNKEYNLPDGSTFILPDEWFEKYQDIMLFGETDKKDDPIIRIKKIHAPILSHAFENITEEKRQHIDDILKIPVERPAIPDTSTALLRPYQKEGFYWMHHLYKHNFGGCLADDMGLGKTLQTITLMQHIYADNSRPLPPTLVLAPTSLLHNWKNEIARFAPELNTLLYAGTDRNRTISSLHPHHVIITSYGTMRNDIDALAQQIFQLIVLDESQYIKNPDSLTYKAVMKLNGRHKLTLTGTPLENSLDDLWAQFNFINKGLLGRLETFRTRYVQPMKSGNTAPAEALKRIIAPFLLRRTKEEVTPDLPPLTEEIIYCDMSDTQTELYNAEKNRIRNMLLDQARETPDAPFNKILALEALHRLRQLANHPAMLIPDYADESGKMEEILLAFDSLRQSGHKALLFSSYVKHLKLLAARFDQRGWKYAILTGETRHREQVIDQFKADDNIHAFFISLKAGSTGLNLTAADYVFILDPWWNPAAEMQALSRAHRIGQNKKVIALRFISTNTVEEKMMQLQHNKTALYNTFINVGNAIDHFTWEDFEQIIE